MVYWLIFLNLFTFTVLAMQIRQMRLCGRRFNFRITDLYVAALLVSPVVALVLELLDQSKFDDVPIFAPFEVATIVVLIALCQLGGMGIGRLDIQLPPYEPDVTAKASVLSVLTGALYGLLLMALPVFFLYYGMRMELRLARISTFRAREDFRPGK